MSLTEASKWCEAKWETMLFTTQFMIQQLILNIIEYSMFKCTRSSWFNIETRTKHLDKFIKRQHTIMKCAENIKQVIEKKKQENHFCIRRNLNRRSELNCRGKCPKADRILLRTLFGPFLLRTWLLLYRYATSQTSFIQQDCFTIISASPVIVCIKATFSKPQQFFYSIKNR